MANNLSSAQRSAFSGGSYDLTKFPYLLELDNGLGTITDISKRVHKIGETTSKIVNLDPSNQDLASYPAASITVFNEDGLFSPNKSGSIWGAQSVLEFVLRLRIYDLVTDPNFGTTLVDAEFALVECKLEAPTANLVAISKIARYWARRWDKEDREEMDWNGWTETFTMP